MSQLKSNLKAVMHFIFLSFIMLSFSMSFAEAVTYTYDDANRLIREFKNTDQEQLKKKLFYF